MNRKRLALLLITVLILVAFSACSTVEKLEHTISTTATTNNTLATDIQGETEATKSSASAPSQTDLFSTTAATNVNETDAVTTVDENVAPYSDILKTEELEKLPDYPSYFFAWASDEDKLANAWENSETVQYFVYDSKPVNVYCQLLNASSRPWEFGLFIEVDGVLQKTVVNGVSSEKHCFELQPLESRIVKMEFVPDVGKKGEIRSLSCAVLISPDYVAKENDDYGIYLEPSISGNYPLAINSAPSKSAEITDNPSLYQVSPINRNIYSVYEDSDNMENFEYYPCCYIYENFYDYIKKEYGAFVRKTRITTKASENSKLIINLHGKAGTYRVSFYLNGERLNVFDRKGYLDVTIGEKQQAEIPIYIDTGKLKGANRIEAYYKEINCDFTQENSIIYSSGPQKYIVK